jgi:site-specific DNA-adenine methylase|tara:strand:- start:871 stop:1080 length:210 start_codon:yes stop_codon:yes gene_type:complete
MSKNELGQFYTTNYKYILSNMFIPNNIKTIIEPFAGKGNLLDFINNKEKYNIEFMILILNMKIQLKKIL